MSITATDLENALKKIAVALQSIQTSQGLSDSNTPLLLATAPAATANNAVSGTLSTNASNSMQSSINNSKVSEELESLHKFMNKNMSKDMFFQIVNFVEANISNPQFDINERDPNALNRKMTPLMRAINIGSVELVEFFVEKKANYNAKDDSGNSVFSYAVSKVCKNSKDKTQKEIALTVVEYLLTLTDIDITSANELDVTPLMLAAGKGIVEIVDKYKNRTGIDVNKKSKKLGATALMMAAEADHVVIAELLIEMGSDIGTLDIYNNDLLMIAAKNKSIDMLRLLKKKGVKFDINATNVSGKTAKSYLDANNQQEYILIQYIDMYLTDALNSQQRSPIVEPKKSNKEEKQVHEQQLVRVAARSQSKTVGDSGDDVMIIGEKTVLKPKSHPGNKNKLLVAGSTATTAASGQSSIQHKPSTTLTPIASLGAAAPALTSAKDGRNGRVNALSTPKNDREKPPAVAAAAAVTVPTKVSRTVTAAVSQALPTATSHRTVPMATITNSSLNTNSTTSQNKSSATVTSKSPSAANLSSKVNDKSKATPTAVPKKEMRIHHFATNNPDNLDSGLVALRGFISRCEKNNCEWYNINIQDDHKKTALIKAVELGLDDRVRCLLQYGQTKANPNVRTKDGSALLIAVNKAIECKNRLNPAGGNSCSNEKEVTETKKARENFISCIRILLLDTRTDIEIANENGTTPLMMATNSDDNEILRLINLKIQKNMTKERARNAAGASKDAVTKTKEAATARVSKEAAAHVTSNEDIRGLKPKSKPTIASKSVTSTLLAAAGTVATATIPPAVVIPQKPILPKAMSPTVPPIPVVTAATTIPTVEVISPKKSIPTANSVSPTMAPKSLVAAAATVVAAPTASAAVELAIAKAASEASAAAFKGEDSSSPAAAGAGSPKPLLFNAVFSSTTTAKADKLSQLKKKTEDILAEVARVQANKRKRQVAVEEEIDKLLVQQEQELANAKAKLNKERTEEDEVEQIYNSFRSKNNKVLIPNNSASSATGRASTAAADTTVSKTNEGETAANINTRNENGQPPNKSMKRHN